VTKFREFWTRDEPKELKESKDLTKSEKHTEPKDLMEPIERTKLNSHPNASPLPNTDPHPPYSSSYTHTQLETFTCTNKVPYRIRSTEPSENDMHIQFHHGVKSDTPPILKQHTLWKPPSILKSTPTPTLKHAHKTQFKIQTHPTAAPEPRIHTHPTPTPNSVFTELEHCCYFFNFIIHLSPPVRARDVQDQFWSPSRLLKLNNQKLPRPGLVNENLLSNF
jgi:hypothetical protein